MTSLTTMIRRLPAATFALTLTIGFIAFSPCVLADQPPPSVQLNSDSIGPRPIEELTSKTITRDYALAWQTLSQALEENRADLLDGYFTGLAKDDFIKVIEEQKKSGVRIRYHDHGHRLEAVFYSPAGDAMQLRDQAQLDIDYLDGDKVLQTEQVNLHYIVLMTPGADRWMVRTLEATPQAKP